MWCSPVGVSVIEVVTSQMVTYGLMAMLQVIPAIIVGIYAFDVSWVFCKTRQGVFPSS